MSTVIHEPEVIKGEAPIVLQMQPVLNLTEDQFFEFCQINRDLRMERTAQGELIVMSPAGSESSSQNANLTYQLYAWSRQDGSGKVYDSSGGFLLPNGAVRAPDASWVSNTRLAQVSAAERKRFLPLAPEFVAELRSPSDRLPDLHAKMHEYVEQGVLFGLLLDPEAKRVYIYQPNQPMQELENCEKVSCDIVLPGFELMLNEIW